jgi:hypothetical protein
MFPLVKKMKLGSPSVLSCPIIRAKGPPTEQEPLPPPKSQGKRLPWAPSKYVSIFFGLLRRTDDPQDCLGIL